MSVRNKNYKKGPNKVYEKKHTKNYYIAIDFDGTLVKDAFPEIGTKKEQTYKKLLRKREDIEKAGYTPIFILWTCREDLPERAYLSEAVDWCKSHLKNINIHSVNTNPFVNFGYPEKVRKIFAHEYWDDKAVEVE